MQVLADKVDICIVNVGRFFRTITPTLLMKKLILVALMVAAAAAV